MNRSEARGRRRILLLGLGLTLAATACGASVDGDQWVDVKVTNTTVAPVTLDTHPVRHLAPGQATVLHVDTNNDPQALRVRAASGQVLGCLEFAGADKSAVARSQSVSDAAPCQQGVRPFPG